MKPIGSSITPGLVAGAGRPVCVRPVQPGRPCGKDVVKPGAQFPSTEGVLCHEHQRESEAALQKRREAAIANLMSLARRTIEHRVDIAIPRLYTDVVDHTDESLPEKDRLAAKEKLQRRLRYCDNFELMVEKAIEAANLILSQPGATVVLSGKSGVGKSTLVALILRMIVTQIPLVLWEANPVVTDGGLFDVAWPPPTLSGQDDPDNPYVLWTSADNLFESCVAGTVEVYKHAPLAVIDDIGKEPEQINIKSVPLITWARQEQMRASIITTGFVNFNVDPETDEYFAPLEQRYGAAFVRRIAERDEDRFLHIHVPHRVR